MKRPMLQLTSTLAIFAALLYASTSYSFESNPKKVPAFYDTIYAPGGFDSNDHVEIVGEGMFRSTCYRPAETRVRVDNLNKTIYVGPAAYEYSGFCLQVLLPFDRVIDVGILEPGNYQIVQASDGINLGKLNIYAATTQSADDYLYAPISQAFFKNKGAKNEIFLTGYFSNSCLKLKDVRVTVEPKVIVVQPIAEMAVDSEQACEDGNFHFEKTVEVDFLKSGRYLLHIRSMNSKSVNTLVDVK